MIEYSRRFALRDWRYYDDKQGRGDRPLRWAFTRDHENKWVYVVSEASDSTRTLLAVLELDNAGNAVLKRLGINQAEGSARLEGGLLTLPRTIHGEALLHYFYGSTVPIEGPLLNELVENVSEWAPAVDLGNENQYAFENDGGGSGLPAWIPIFDPLAIAHGYADILTAATERWLRHMTRDDRIPRLFVGKTLSGLIRSSPDMASKLGPEMDIAAMHANLEALERDEKALMQQREEAGAVLAAWLRTPAMEHVERCYRAHEQEHYAELLADMAYFVVRLKDTKAGIELVRAWAESPPHFIQKYVVPVDAWKDSDAVRQTVLALVGVGESVFGLWQSMAYGMRVGAGTESQVRRLVDGFNNTFGGSVLGKPIVLAQEFDTGRIRLQPNDQAIWAPHALGVANFAARAATFCTIANAAFAIHNILDDNPTPFGTTSAGFSLVEGGLSSVAAYRALGAALAAKTGAAATEAAALSAMTHLGAAAAMTAVFSDTFGGIDAASVGDTSKAWGHGLSASGAALLFWGTASAVTGVPGATLLLAGALLSAGGFVLTAFTEDEALEIFARHCFWGHSFGRDSGTPVWAGTTLSQWPAKPALQLQALLNILFGFEVAHATRLLAQQGKGGIQITYGAALEDSVFHIEWTIEYDDGPNLITHHTVKPSSRELKQVSGPPLAPITLVWDPALGGRPRFAIETPHQLSGPVKLTRGRCKVWLDVDGTHRLPVTFVPWSFVMPTDDTDFQRDPPRASVDY